MMDKFFNEKNDSELHVTCKKCKHYVGILCEVDDDFKCRNCGEPADTTNPSSDNIIAVIDPSEIKLTIVIRSS